MSPACNTLYRQKIDGKDFLYMDSLQIDYDNVLIGAAATVDSSNFFGTKPGGANQNRALSCVRYAIEKVLEWNEDKAISDFDEYMIRVMKLDKIVEFIDFPVEVQPGNSRYILSLLYPARIKLNQQKLVEETFQTILDARKFDAPKGKNSENDDQESHGRQFPREYFSGVQGFYRFCYCLNYLLQYYKPMHSVEEVYEFFSSPEGKQFLYDYRLKIPADQFSISIMDVIHHITRFYPDSDWWYYYFSLSNEINRLLMEEAEKEVSNEKVVEAS